MNGHQPAPGLGAGWELYAILVSCCLAIAAASYAAALWRTRRRSPWPRRRVVSFHVGLSCVAGLLGPIVQAAHTSFTAHMAGHLLLGMIHRRPFVSGEVALRPAPGRDGSGP